MTLPGPVKSTTKTSAHAGAAASRTAVVDAPTIRALRKLMYIVTHHMPYTDFVHARYLIAAPSLGGGFGRLAVALP